MDDCASLYEFHVGNDFFVDSHEGRTTGQPCPVAGLALLMFLVQHDVDVHAGSVTLTLPGRPN